MTTCATTDCSAATAGRSKYCAEHRAEARKAWLERVQADKAARSARDSEYDRIYAEAHEKGMEAAAECQLMPLAFREGSSGQVFEIEDACGFAYVTIRPGNSSFAHWVKKHPVDNWGKAYYGGVSRSIQYFNQSYSRKGAYAQAFANHLQLHNIRATAESRMD